MARGKQASGDLVPWTISQQFQDPEFASLSGVRVVRIATHPDVQKMGYGTRAMELLHEFFDGRVVPSGENQVDEAKKLVDEVDGDLHNEVIKPRAKIPPLLQRLEELPKPYLDYVSVSFGVTAQLYAFWKRLNYLPLYLRLTANDLTGEHTCIVVRTAGSLDVDSSDGQAAWLKLYHADFVKRVQNLLGYNFRTLPPGLALSLLESPAETEEEAAKRTKSLDQLTANFSPHDLRRLESYAKNLLDYHVIMDAVPTLSSLYFKGSFGPELHLSPAQSAILMSLGLQRKSVDDLEKDLGLPANQILALFNKIIRKFSSRLRQNEESLVAEELGEAELEESGDLNAPLRKTLNEDLEEGATEARKKHGDLLAQYSVAGNDKEWERAVGSGGAKDPPNVVSVKVKRRISESPAEKPEAAAKKEKKTKSKKTKKA